MEINLSIIAFFSWLKTLEDIYLCMKEGCLFCRYEIHETWLQIMFLVSLENSQQGGANVLGSVTLWCKSS
jgi:hypothetical protein